MRRCEYKQFKKDTLIGLLQDCAYYCWQHSQIDDDELLELNTYCDLIYIQKKISEVKND